MPHFTIWDHPQMPLCQITVGDTQRLQPDKFGFRPRYSLFVVDANHAHDVIAEIDLLMGRRAKAHGVYQAPYDEVRAAYQTLLDAVPRDRVKPVLRVLSGLAGLSLLTAWCFVVPGVVTFVVLLTALRRESGFEAMYSASIIWNAFDMRPTVRRLIAYALRP